MKNLLLAPCWFRILARRRFLGKAIDDRKSSVFTGTELCLSDVRLSKAGGPYGEVVKADVGNILSDSILLINYLKTGGKK